MDEQKKKVKIQVTVSNPNDVPVSQHNALQEEAARFARILGKGITLRTLRTAFYQSVIEAGKQAAQEA